MGLRKLNLVLSKYIKPSLCDLCQLTIEHRPCDVSATSKPTFPVIDFDAVKNDYSPSYDKSCDGLLIKDSLKTMYYFELKGANYFRDYPDTEKHACFAKKICDSQNVVSIVMGNNDFTGVERTEVNSCDKEYYIIPNNSSYEERFRTAYELMAFTNSYNRGPASSGYEISHGVFIKPKIGHCEVLPLL